MNELKKISRYPVPTLDEVPDDLKEIFIATQEKIGFIPNVFFALAHRPAELRAFLAYNDALMNKESGLTASEKEMIIIAFSSVNGCTYCVMSHGATLRLESGNPLLADQIAVNYHEADLNKREKALINFAMKVSSNSSEINESDFDELKKHGLSDEDIWDIAGITAFFNLSNRMMNFAAVRADDQFYSLGR